jgi:hypothetical protein
MTRLTAETARQLLTYDGEHLRWKVNRTGTARKGTIAGTTASKQYRTIRILGKTHAAHRVIWLIVHGHCPKHKIDHIDGNPLNNRIENLRDVTADENNRNMKRPNNNTSGHIGVYWDKTRSRWAAFIKVGRKQTTVGRFHNKDDAIAARIRAEKQHCFHKNHGRG